MTGSATKQASGEERGGSRQAMRAAFLAFSVLAVAVWIGIAVGANARTPGVIGLAATVFGGLFAFVLTLAVGGAIALKLGVAGAGERRSVSADAAPELGEALAELEMRQGPVERRMQERAAWCAPLGATTGIALWSAVVALGVPGGVLDFSAVMLAGGLAGMAYARMRAARENAAIYTTRAVGVLVSGLGALAWRDNPSVDLPRLNAAGILPPATGVATRGDVAGAQAGLSLRITPIETIPPAGAGSAARFTGLLIAIDAPQHAGTEIEALAAARPRLRGLIDQLAALPNLGKPSSVIADGRLLIALPETDAPRVFDPPSRPGQLAAAPALARIRQVVGSVLQLADALAAPPQA